MRLLFSSLIMRERSSRLSHALTLETLPSLAALMIDAGICGAIATAPSVVTYLGPLNPETLRDGDVAVARRASKGSAQSALDAEHHKSAGAAVHTGRSALGRANSD